MTDLSIIIVNFNTAKLVKDCVVSVKKHIKDLNYEIIVVDNASTDGSAGELGSLDVKLIKSHKNLGFGGGNNLGIKEAEGNTILLLNSDTLVEDEVIQKTYAYLKEHSKVGVLGCALESKDGSLQLSGGYFPTLGKVFYWMSFLDDIPFLGSLLKPYHLKHFKRDNERDLDWVTGAFFMVKKVALKEAGVFDPDYFMYAEEVDLCFRIKEKGWQVKYLPQYKITHLGGASTTSAFSILSEYKGLKLFYKKHYPAWQFNILRSLLRKGSVIRMFTLGLFRKGVFSLYAKAFQTA